MCANLCEDVMLKTIFRGEYAIHMPQFLVENQAIYSTLGDFKQANEK
jgi:hypothetical protein